MSDPKPPNTEDEAKPRNDDHPIVRYCYQQGRRLAAAVPGTLQGALGVVQAVQALRLRLADPKAERLRNCTPESVFNALLQGMRYGLDPAPTAQQFAIVPYGKEAQFQFMYQGLRTLMMRSGLYRSITARAVFENDRIEIDLDAGTVDHKLSKDDLTKPRGKLIAAYCKVVPFVGDPILEVLRTEDIAAIRKKSAGGSEAWRDFEDEQSRKSALKRCSKWCERSPDVMRAIHDDNESETREEPEPTPAEVIPQSRQIPQHIDAEEIDRAYEREKELARAEREAPPAPAPAARPEVQAPQDDDLPFGPSGDDGGPP